MCELLPQLLQKVSMNWYWRMKSLPELYDLPTVVRQRILKSQLNKLHRHWQFWALHIIGYPLVLFAAVWGMRFAKTDQRHSLQFYSVAMLAFGLPMLTFGVAAWQTCIFRLRNKTAIAAWNMSCLRV